MADALAAGGDSAADSLKAGEATGTPRADASTGPHSETGTLQSERVRGGNAVDASASDSSACGGSPQAEALGRGSHSAPGDPAIAESVTRVDGGSGNECGGSNADDTEGSVVAAVEDAADGIENEDGNSNAESGAAASDHDNAGDAAIAESVARVDGGSGNECGGSNAEDTEGSVVAAVDDAADGIENDDGNSNAESGAAASDHDNAGDAKPEPVSEDSINDGRNLEPKTQAAPAAAAAAAAAAAVAATEVARVEASTSEQRSAPSSPPASPQIVAKTAPSKLGAVSRPAPPSNQSAELAAAKKTAADAQEHARTVQKQLLSKMAQIDTLKESVSRSKRELRYAVEDRDTALKSRDETQADLQAYLRVVESKTKEMVAAQEVAKRAKAQAETARQEARKAKASLAELKRTSAAKNSLLSKKVAAQEDELTFLRNGWLRDIYTVFNPSKLSEAQALLQRYKGFERKMFEAMQKKYDFVADAKKRAATQRQAASLEKQLDHVLQQNTELRARVAELQRHSAVAPADASANDGQLALQRTGEETLPTVESAEATTPGFSEAAETEKDSIDSTDKAVKVAGDTPGTEDSAERANEGTSTVVQEPETKAEGAAASIEAGATPAAQSKDDEISSPGNAEGDSLSQARMAKEHQQEVLDLIENVTKLKGSVLALHGERDSLRREKHGLEQQLQTQLEAAEKVRKAATAQKARLRKSYRAHLTTMYSLTAEYKNASAVCLQLWVLSPRNIVSCHSRLLDLSTLRVSWQVDELLEKYRGVEEELVAAVMGKYGVAAVGQELRDLRVKTQQLSDEVAGLTSFQEKQKNLLEETEDSLQKARQDAATAAEAAAKALAASEATSADLKQQLKASTTECNNLRRKLTSVEQSLATSRDELKTIYQEKIAVQRTGQALARQIAQREMQIMGTEDVAVRQRTASLWLDNAIRHALREAQESNFRCQVSKPGMGKSTVSIVSARLDWRFGLLSMQTVAAMSTNRVLEKMAIGAGVTNPSNPFAAPKAQLPTLYIPVLTVYKLMFVETQALSRSRSAANFAGHPTCVRCGLKFTTLRRRHHCRQCGNAVCNACSRQRLKLDNFGQARPEAGRSRRGTEDTISAVTSSSNGKAVRVCDDCYASNAETGNSDDADMCRLELMSRWAPFNLQFTVPEEPSSFGTSERDTNQGEDPKTVLIQWQWWLCTAHALARRQTLSSRSVLEIYNVRLIPARGRVAFEVPSFDSRGVVWWRFSGNPTTDAKNQAKKRAVLQKMGMEGNAADLNSTSSRSLANSQGTSSSQAGPRVGFSVLFRPFSEAEGWKPASATSIGKHLRAGDRSSTRLPTSFEGIYDSDSDDPFEHNLGPTTGADSSASATKQLPTFSGKPSPSPSPMVVVCRRTEQVADVMRCGFACGQEGPGRYVLVFDAENCTEAQPVHFKLAMTSSMKTEPTWFGWDVVGADGV